MAYQKDTEKYLITGANGQLGYALQKALGGDEGQAMPRSHEAFDIADTEQVSEWIPTIKPDAVINCAAYTNVIQAEREREDCWRTNAMGVDNLARVCAEHEIPFFHISTDFVYGQDFARCMLNGDSDFTRDTPLDMDAMREEMLYKESCPVGPVGHYAYTKTAGEHAILQHASENAEFNYYIIRTAGLFEKPWRQGSNFPFRIANKLLKGGGEPLEVVTDVYSSLCYVEHLVPAIRWMIENRNEWSSQIGPVVPKGIYHIANRGTATWYEVAQAIARVFGNSKLIRPTTRERYAKSLGVSPSLMPGYTCLDIGKYDDTTGPAMPHWDVAIEQWCKLAKDYLK